MKITVLASAVLFTCSINSSMAADNDGIKPAFGFDLSFGYALANDRRFTGSTIGFELSLLQIHNDIRISYYHEQGRWRGRDGEDSVSARSVFNAIHFDYPIYTDEHQAVSIIANAGHVEFHASGNEKGAFAADLGLHYDPLILNARGVTTQFGMQMIYRYSHIDSTDVFDNGNLVSDAGGFIVGVHGLVRF